MSNDDNNNSEPTKKIHEMAILKEKKEDLTIEDFTFSDKGCIMNKTLLYKKNNTYLSKMCERCAMANLCEWCYDNCHSHPEAADFGAKKIKSVDITSSILNTPCQCSLMCHKAPVLDVHVDVDEDTEKNRKNHKDITTCPTNKYLALCSPKEIFFLKNTKKLVCLPCIITCYNTHIDDIKSNFDCMNKQQYDKQHKELTEKIKQENASFEELHDFVLCCCSSRHNKRKILSGITMIAENKMFYEYYNLDHLPSLVLDEKEKNFFFWPIEIYIIELSQAIDEDRYKKYHSIKNTSSVFVNSLNLLLALSTFENHVLPDMTFLHKYINIDFLLKLLSTRFVPNDKLFDLKITFLKVVRKLFLLPKKNALLSYFGNRNITFLHRHLFKQDISQFEEDTAITKNKITEIFSCLYTNFLGYYSLKSNKELLMLMEETFEWYEMIIDYDFGDNTKIKILKNITENVKMVQKNKNFSILKKKFEFFVKKIYYDYHDNKVLEMIQNKECADDNVMEDLYLVLFNFYHTHDDEITKEDILSKNTEKSKRFLSSSSLYELFLSPETQKEAFEKDLANLSSFLNIQDALLLKNDDTEKTIKKDLDIFKKRLRNVLKEKKEADVLSFENDILQYCDASFGAASQDGSRAQSSAENTHQVKEERNPTSQTQNFDDDDRSSLLLIKNDQKKEKQFFIARNFLEELFVSLSYLNKCINHVDTTVILLFKNTIFKIFKKLCEGNPFISSIFFSRKPISILLDNLFLSVDFFSYLVFQTDSMKTYSIHFSVMVYELFGITEITEVAGISFLKNFTFLHDIEDLKKEKAVFTKYSSSLYDIKIVSELFKQEASIFTDNIVVYDSKRLLVFWTNIFFLIKEIIKNNSEDRELQENMVFLCNVLYCSKVFEKFLQDYIDDLHNKTLSFSHITSLTTVTKQEILYEKKRVSFLRDRILLLKHDFLLSFYGVLNEFSQDVFAGFSFSINLVTMQDILSYYNYLPLTLRMEIFRLYKRMVLTDFLIPTENDENWINNLFSDKKSNEVIGDLRNFDFQNEKAITKKDMIVKEAVLEKLKKHFLKETFIILDSKICVVKKRIFNFMNKQVKKKEQEKQEKAEDEESFDDDDDHHHILAQKRKEYDKIYDDDKEDDILKNKNNYFGDDRDDVGGTEEDKKLDFSNNKQPAVTPLNFRSLSSSTRKTPKESIKTKDKRHKISSATQTNETHSSENVDQYGDLFGDLGGGYDKPLSDEQDEISEQEEAFLNKETYSQRKHDYYHNKVLSYDSEKPYKTNFVKLVTQYIKKELNMHNHEEGRKRGNSSDMSSSFHYQKKGRYQQIKEQLFKKDHEKDGTTRKKSFEKIQNSAKKTSEKGINTDFFIPYENVIDKKPSALLSLNRNNYDFPEEKNKNIFFFQDEKEDDDDDDNKQDDDDQNYIIDEDNQEKQEFQEKILKNLGRNNNNYDNLAETASFSVKKLQKLQNKSRKPTEMSHSSQDLEILSNKKHHHKQKRLIEYYEDTIIISSGYYKYLYKEDCSTLYDHLSNEYYNNKNFLEFYGLFPIINSMMKFRTLYIINQKTISKNIDLTKKKQSCFLFDEEKREEMVDLHEFFDVFVLDPYITFVYKLLMFPSSSSEKTNVYLLYKFTHLFVMCYQYYLDLLDDDDVKKIFVNEEANFLIKKKSSLKC